MHYIFHTVKTESAHIEAVLYKFHHTGILRTTLAGVSVQIYRFRFLNFVDKFSCDQFQSGPGRRKVEKGAGVNDRWATYSDVDLLGTVTIKSFDIVLKLCAAYYGIVTKGYSFIFYYGVVWDKFHFGNQFPCALADGSKAAGPCSVILD
jgi:hypothetical protein